MDNSHFLPEPYPVALLCETLILPIVSLNSLLDEV